MTAPKATIKGIYALTVNQDLLEEAMVTKYGGVKLDPEQKQAARDAIQEELSHVVLVDLLVKNVPEEYNFADIPQGAEQEKPYSLMYLTLDGSAAISRKRPAGEKDIRVSFYLHDLRPEDKLTLADNELALPAPKPMDFVMFNNNPYRPRVKVNAAIAAAVGKLPDRVLFAEGKGFWIRAAAYVIDGLVIYLVNYAIAFCVGIFLVIYMELIGTDYVFNEVLSEKMNLPFGILMQVFYFGIFEWAYGATIGKMILQMRVVKEDGTPGGLWPIFLRTLLRYVDGLFFGIPAALSMRHNYNQRIGDRAAKTFVVSSRDPDIKKKRSGYLLFLAIPGYLFVHFVLIVILLIILLQIKTLTI